MFEIPDDDENFWNQVPLDVSFLSKPGSLVGKDNRPQLRVPDTACTGNPAKRLCNDFNRDGSLPAQADQNKSSTQFRSVSTVGNSCLSNVSRLQGESDDSSVQREAPFYIPFPAATPAQHLNSKSSMLASYKGGNIEINNRTTSSGSDIRDIRSDRRDIRSDRRDIRSDRSKSDKDESVIANFQDKLNGFHSNKETSNQPHCKQRETASAVNGMSRSNENETRRMSRLNENEARDHVTPKRKRKFPGPAGILPKLVPGRNLDMLSPATLNTTSPAPDKSPQDDGVILCSQQTDDIFNDPAWQTLLTDLGDDGQKLLKKFSISLTLLKAGKKQLLQGKAALIFGVIDSIESHGSEASVTIRDRSGRMQGTVHRDLLKDHEADLQIGTVLVLKQVSIISLSNRNHYLNITPNNVVMLYHGGQSSLRSLKFHGSEDSLQSVLSALEKKAATQRNNMNSSLSMTPSSQTGSSRHSLTDSGTGTPQLFGASPLTGMGASTPQRYSASPSTPVPNQLFNSRTSVTGNSPGVRAPVLTGVRDVSVMERNISQTNHRQNSFTPNFNNTGIRQGMSTPIANANLRSESSVSDNTFFSTPNTNFKVVPIQNDKTISHISTKVNSPLLNQNTWVHRGANTISPIGVSSTVNDASNIQQQNSQANPVLNTPSTGGKSRWKFKSPPGRSGSLPPSPDLSAIPGNSLNNRLGNTHGVKSMAVPNIGSAGSRTENSAIRFSSGNVSDSKSNGPIGRSCQLNDTNVGRKTDTSFKDHISLGSGTSSAWSFKTSRTVPTVGGKENQPGHTDTFATHVSDDNLWEDDLSDDLLSQLSEDLS